MHKRTLLATLMVGMLIFGSGCCGGLRNWLHCGQVGGASCGGCGSCGIGDCGPGRMTHWRGVLGIRACDPCSSPVTRGRCGIGGGCGLFDLFGWGCGEVYWGDHVAVPVDQCEPCDSHGNWTGHGQVHHGTVHHHGPTHMPYEGEVIYGPEMPMEAYEEVVPHSATRMPTKRHGKPTPAKPLASRPRVAY